MNYVKITKNISFEIRTQRRKLGMTQAHLAKASYQNVNRIKKIETLKVKKISYDDIKNIYDALELDIKNILPDMTSKYHVGFTKQEALRLESVMEEHDLLTKNEALSFLISNYFDVEAMKKIELKFDNLLLKTIDSYTKSILIPLLIEYKVDENILKRIEEDVEPFDLSTEKKFEKNNFILNSFNDDESFFE